MNPTKEPSDFSRLPLVGKILFLGIATVLVVVVSLAVSYAVGWLVHLNEQVWSRK